MKTERIRTHNAHIIFGFIFFLPDMETNTEVDYLEYE